MLDSRYPFLSRVDDSEIPSAWQPYYRKVCEEVHRRTGLQGCYRKPSGELYFYLGDPSRAVWSEKIRRPMGQPGDRWMRVDVEQTVRICVQWKASKQVKQRWVDEQERLDKEFKAQAEREFLDERRPDAVDQFKKIRTNRRSFLKSGRLGQKAVA